MKLLQSNLSINSFFHQFDLNTFVRWWGQGLLACLPRSVSELLLRSPVRTVLEVHDDQVLVLQEQHGKAQEVGHYALDSLRKNNVIGKTKSKSAGQLVLRLPGQRGLTKTISLPLAAEANLRQVVGFEMDRLTPFSADKVYYAVHVLRRDLSAKRLQVVFIALPRAQVDELLKRLGTVGLFPDSVDVVGGDPSINLLPPEKRPRKGRVAQHVREALLVLFLGLVFALAMLPLWQKQHIINDELIPRVDAAQQQAEEIMALRTELENSLESSRFLLQKRQTTPLVIDVIDELTRILPDGTWVERLEIKDNEIQIRGQSSKAPTLIGLVEASDLFHNATFGSPITADRRTGKDRFYLSARVSRES